MERQPIIGDRLDDPVENLIRHRDDALVLAVFGAGVDGDGMASFS